MSKLDDLLTGYAQEDAQSSKLKSNYAVYKDDPEQFSNVVDISKKTGLPVATVENNLPEAQKRAQEPDWAAVQTEAPKTSALLAKDINFFRQAKDDVEGLKEIEKSFDQYKRTGAIESGFRGFMRGLGGLATNVGSLQQRSGITALVPGQEAEYSQDVFDKVDRKFPPILRNWAKERLAKGNEEIRKRNQENLEKWNTKIAAESPGMAAYRKQFAQEQIEVGRQDIEAGQELSKEWKPDDYTEARSFIDNLKDEPVKTTLTTIGEQAPNVAVSLVAGLVTRGLGRVGSVGSMGLVSYEMEGGDIFNEGSEFLQKKYGSFDKVPKEEWGKLLTLTNEHAAFNAVLDTVMPANLLKSTELKTFARKSLFGKVFSAQGLKEISKESIENLALELPTEIVQETSSIAAQESLGQTFTTEQKQNRYLQIAIGSAGIGSISGAAKGVSNVAAAKPDQSVVFKGAMDEVQQQAKSTQEQGFLSRIFTATEAVKNKKILNQTIDNLSDTETENVYISAETVSTLFQDSDIPPESKTAQAILEQVNKANALDGDIILPLKDFISDVQGTKTFEALRPHLRVSPGAMSQAELDSGAGTEKVKALIAEAETHAQIKEEADTIYNTVRDQLIATGRLSPSAAGYSAQIIPAYVATQSARTGRSVAEIYQSMGLRIEGPERRAEQTAILKDKPGQETVIEPVPTDRRKNQPGRGERRKAAEQVKRSILDKLSPEERQAMLKSDVIPSLGGLRAFEYHIKDTPDQRVMFLDFDDFKAVNDKLGEEETDIAILDPAGAIIAEAAEEAGIKAFHRSGDEFLAAGATDAQLDAFAKNLREKLKNADLVAILPDGTEDTFKSIGFSYGLGQDEKSARKLAKEQKAERKRSGERTGSRDSGVAGQAPEGDAVRPPGETALDQSATLNQGAPKGASSVSDDAALLKSLGDSLPRNAAFLRDITQSDAFREHGLDGFDIPGQRVVLSAVGRMLNDRKILDSVIKLIPIDVMNILGREKFSPDVLLHNPAVFAEIFSADSDNAIPGFMDAASALVRAVAGVSAENIALSLNQRDGSFDGDRATGADKLTDATLPKSSVTGGAAKHGLPLNLGGEAKNTGATTRAGEGGHGSSSLYSVGRNSISGKATIRQFDPNDPSILNQPPPPLDGHKRGHIQFDDEGAIIRMFEASDFSTFLHEAGHLFLNTEAKFAAIKLTAEHKAILDFLGAKDFQSITREQHETWARSFEAYLMEGKAPSLELRDAFSKFRDWLLQIYKSLTGLRVNMNPEIRAIFDRMLATDEQIAIAHSDMNYGLMFKDIKSAGMTEAEWSEYQKKKQRSKDKATSTLQEKILKALTRETEKWWKDELYAKRAEIREVLKERKVYKATEYLKDSSGKNRLNRETVKALLGVDVLPSRLRKTTSEHEGLNPDEVAVVMGYQSGHEMLMDILQTPSFTEAVNAEAEARMKAEHGDILNDGTLEAQAIEAAHDEARGEVLLTELRTLSRRARRPMIDRDALKAQAHDVISRAKLSEIRPDKYRRAEIRAAQKAQKAFDSGDMEAAHQAKAQQIANFYLWKAATEAKNTADKQRAYLSKVGNRKYDPKDINPEYIRQMKLLAAVYDFRKGGEERSAAQLQAIATWLQAQTESEDTHVNPVIIDINLTNALQAIKEKQPIQVKHYNDMTVEELRGVHDMVKHLRYIGGKLSENEKAVFAARTEKTAQSIIENGTKVVIVPEEKSKRFDAMEKLRQLGQDHLGLANHIEELDGFKLFGPMFEEFYQAIINASNTELKFRREIGEKLQAAFKGFKSKDLREGGFIREGAGSKTITKQNGESWTLTARGRIMLALYWGSPESRAAIIEAHGSEQDVQKMLDFITDKEADLIQEIWNINESMWPHLRDTAIEMSGVSPPKVDHVPFKIGKRDMPGGYMRLFYEEDVRDSVLLDVDSQGKLVRSGARVISNTKHGSRNSRVGSGGRKLSWDMDNVFRALDEIIHDVSFAKTASDTSRFLKSKPIREAITHRYGKEKYKAIQQTLSNVIAGKVDGGSGLLNTIMRVPRIAGTYAFLGYSIKNLIQQPIAMTNMLGRIGEKEVLAAAMDVYWNPTKWMKFVQDRSEFITNRTSLINRDISEAIGKIDSGILSGPLKRHAFDLQTIGDAIAVYPGWVAAYRQGLDKFANEQKAITYADEVVAETIGSGMMKDMSPLLQGKAESAKGLGPEALKLFTFMYSYFNVVGRLTRSAAKRNNLKTIQGFSQYSREMAWYLIAPALIGAWIVGNGPDDDESWLLWAAKNIGLYRLAQFVGLRELTGLIQGYSPSTPITRALSGSVSAAKTTVEVMGDEKELDLANTAKILKGAASVVIIPGAGQAARTLDYIGSEPDEFDIYQALVIGK